MLHSLVFTICVTLASGSGKHEIVNLSTFGTIEFIIIISIIITKPNKGVPYYGGSVGRMIGGTRVNHTEQFPYVVSISRLDQHICNGVIYNDRWVITTAKCVHG
jgi:hypothetical protein